MLPPHRAALVMKPARSEWPPNRRRVVAGGPDDGLDQPGDGAVAHRLVGHLACPPDPAEHEGSEGPSVRKRTLAYCTQCPGRGQMRQ